MEPVDAESAAGRAAVLGRRELARYRLVLEAFCGVKDFSRRNFEPIVMSTPEQRAGWLPEVRETIAQRFPA